MESLQQQQDEIRPDAAPTEDTVANSPHQLSPSSTAPSQTGPEVPSQTGPDGRVLNSDGTPVNSQTVPPSLLADEGPPISPPSIEHPKRVSRSKPSRRQSKKEGMPTKPGKSSWVYGTKLAFFSLYKEAYLLASSQPKKSDRNKLTGDLYTKLAKLFCLKYGYDMADDEDLEFDIPNPPDELADVVVNEVLAEGEAERRSEYKKLLRARIGAWFRAQYGALLKEDKVAFAELFTGVLDDSPPKPQRPQLLHFYSRKFYAERVKEHFEERFEVEKQRCLRLGKDAPTALHVSNLLTQERWDSESFAFQEEVKAAREREYEMAVKGWEMSRKDSPTRTAEEFDVSLNNAVFYLQPFVDAIAERFGMVMGLLLAGPIGSRGGAVGVQSVHSGKTRGPVELDWPQFDPAGFAEAEVSMIAFAKQHFTDAECRARAVGGSGKVRDETTPAKASGNGTMGTMATPAAAGMTTPASTVTSMPAPVRSRAPAPSMSGGVDGRERDALGGRVNGGEGGTPGGGEHSTPGDGEGGTLGGGEGRDALVDAEATMAAELESQIDAMWKRDDRAEWTPGLVHAHAALERGRTWGPEWAALVSDFFDFEKVWGFKDAGGKSDVKWRPLALKNWLRGRKWDQLIGIERAGSKGESGTFSNHWWRWWNEMQPAERKIDDGPLSFPTDADWTYLSTLHGKDGFLHVMAALLWWGDYVWTEPTSAIEQLGWSDAVADVTYVLRELQRPAVLKVHGPTETMATRTMTKRKRMATDAVTGDAGDAPRGKRRKVAEAAEGPSTRSSSGQDQRQTRSKNAAKRRS
ncbi:hypothetical protein DFH07DRAFT_959686 [Mycena maculata]|uniref:Uncharacterized protein n=1 Tax=Mycena maculata TaxID=230809 RepID=A0AAD7NBE2_9AGAR|nr:hypothetical protein DFH07DRAFT_959686 [Mycena maculata]